MKKTCEEKVSKGGDVCGTHTKLKNIKTRSKCTMKIRGKFKAALARKANEAVRMFRRSSLESLNSKSEFTHPPLVRVVIDRKYT